MNAHLSSRAQNISFTWIVLCLIFVPTLFYLPALDYLNLPRELFWTISGCFLILYLLWSKQLSHFLEFDHFSKLLILFMIWAAISSIWAWQPQLSWVRWSILVITFFTFLITKKLHTKHLQLILWVLAIQGLLGSILGVLQYLHIEPFSLILQTDKPGITMGHRNVAAEYMLMCLGATMALFKNTKVLRNTSLVIILAAITTIIIIIYCRGVYLGIALTVCYSIFLFFLKINKLWIKLCLSAFVIILLTLFIVAAFAKLPGLQSNFAAGKQNSMKMRIAHYSNTLVLSKDSFPKGVGLGNFPLNYSLYLNSWVPDIHYSDKLILRNAHSDPLECLAELGPVGLMILFTILYFLFFKIPILSWQDRIISFTLLAQFFNSCVNFPFQIIQSQFVIAILLGILCHKKQIGNLSVFSMPKSLSIKIVISILICFYFQFQWNRLQASKEARLGLELMVAKQHPTALPHLRNAKEKAPRDVDIVMLLAYCLREMSFRTESSSLAENVLGVFPGYLPAYNLIGLNALDINNLNRAVKAFENSYQRQAYQESTKVKLTVSYAKLAQEFRKQGYFKQAFELEKKLFKVMPSAIDSLYRQVMDLIITKDLNSSRTIYTSIPSHTKDPRYIFVGAKLLHAEQKLIEAFELLEKGLKDFPKDQALLNLQHELQNLKR